MIPISTLAGNPKGELAFIHQKEHSTLITCSRQNSRESNWIRQLLVCVASGSVSFLGWRAGIYRKADAMSQFRHVALNFWVQPTLLLGGGANPRFEAYQLSQLPISQPPPHRPSTPLSPAPSPQLSLRTHPRTGIHVQAASSNTFPTDASADWSGALETDWVWGD